MKLTAFGAKIVSAIHLVNGAEIGEAIEAPRLRVAKSDQWAVNRKSLRVSLPESPHGTRQLT
jgi:hypothetical protein